jgi:hypothetical protein
MTDDEFRALALAQPGAIESSHVGHADFRAEGKIFAGFPKLGIGSLKLTPEEQEVAMAISPAFTPAAGAWGQKGWTMVDLTKVDADFLAAMMVKARANVAKKPRTSRARSTPD